MDSNDISVKRFQDQISCGGEYSSCSYMEEQEDGEYVLFSDYQKLLTLIKKLEDELERVLEYHK